MRVFTSESNSAGGITVTHHGDGTDTYLDLDAGTLAELGFVPKQGDTPYPGYVMTIEEAQRVMTEIRDFPHKPAQRAMGRMAVRLKIPLIDVVLKHGDPRKWERVEIRRGHVMSQDDATALLSKFGLKGDEGKSLLDEVARRACGRSPAMVLMQEGDPLDWSMFAYLRNVLNKREARKVLDELDNYSQSYSDVLVELRKRAGGSSLLPVIMREGDPREWDRFKHYLPINKAQKIVRELDRDSVAWSHLLGVAQSMRVPPIGAVMHCGDPREWPVTEQTEEAEEAKCKRAMDVGLARAVWLKLDNTMSRLVLDACKEDESALELIQRLGDPGDWTARVTGVEGKVVAADVFVPALSRAAAVKVWEEIRFMPATGSRGRLNLYGRMSEENLDLIECIQRHGDPRRWK